jgi:uncharacterized protein (TIGR02001 family)
MQTRKTLLSAAVLAVLALPAVSMAQTAPAAEPASPHTLTANVGLYSQYIFRGLTQTNEDPALQGGFDYAHASGFYLGTWGSNISWLKDGGQYASGGSLELDFYGGFKKSVGDFTFDVGLLQYWYPGDTTSNGLKGDTLELYGAAGWKWFTIKYSSVISNKAFAVADAGGTGYWDFGATFPVGDTGLTLGAHYGIQTFRGTDSRNPGGASNDDLFSYNDWRISAAYDLGKISKALGGAEFGVMYTDTSGADACGYGSTGDTGFANGAPCSGVYPKNIADGQFTAWFKKTF